ncbi:MAG: quinone-dependent dihydroorotate dehydrogenase [Hyphomicrobiales bacterium]
MLFDLARPFLHAVDAEQAHRLTIAALKAGVHPRQSEPDPPSLAVQALGLSFPNPLGMAAGFDKNAEVPDALLAMGFGFAEAGTVTPRPQAGNPKPRVFRLPRDRGVINRLGFNNDGHVAVLGRLEARARRGGIVGVNIGANKDTEDMAADYVLGLAAFYGFASYFTVNISSPNTPGLRGLQARGPLDDLIGRLLDARARLAPEGGAPTPLLVKIAPDLTDEQLADVAAVCVARKVDGVIVSNTTLARDGLEDENAREQGGLSGAPLFELSTRVLADFARATERRLPLVGVGGVTSAETAYAKITAGASLVQLYTGLVYDGPELVAKIKRGLARALERDGFGSVAEAVGAKL